MTRLAARLFDLAPESSEADLQDQVAKTLAAGFDGVELIVPLPGPTHDVPEPPMLPVLFTGSLRRSNLAVRAIAGCCTAIDQEAAFEEVGRLLEQAAGLGARCLNLRIPPVAADPGEPGPPRFARYQDALNFAYQLLHRIRHDAEATGVALALEAAVGGCLMSPVELREIIDAANSWAVGVCVDVSRVAGVGRPDDWITTLGSRIHSVRTRVETSTGATTETPSLECSAADGLRKALDQAAYDRLVIAAGNGAPDDQHAHLAALGC